MMCGAGDRRGGRRNGAFDPLRLAAEGSWILPDPVARATQLEYTGAVAASFVDGDVQPAATGFALHGTTSIGHFCHHAVHYNIYDFMSLTGAH